MNEIVNTQADLEALPIDSVIRDSDRVVMELYGNSETRIWYAVGSNADVSNWIELPATVLYRGGK